MRGGQKCNSTSATLDRVSLDGRITFRYTAPGDREGIVQCFAEAGRTGQSLPEPIARATISSSPIVSMALVVRAPFFCVGWGPKSTKRRRRSEKASTNWSAELTNTRLWHPWLRINRVLRVRVEDTSAKEPHA